MVHLVKKKVKNNLYLYLEQRKWIDKKSIREFSVYLGSEKKLIKNPKRIHVFDIENVKTNVIEFGLPAILARIAKGLKMTSIVNQSVNKRNQGISVGEYITIATINRGAQPTSKAKLSSWYNSSFVKFMFPDCEQNLDSMAYVNHFKYLTEDNIENIELDIVKVLQNDYNVKMNELMYDPTNFFTYINPKTIFQKLSRHGKSKENRHTLNLVALSLFCTKDDGIPIMHNVYPGNIQDATHFKDELPRFIKRLDNIGMDISSVVLVFDKGNISEDGFKIIDGSQFKWISSVRPSSHKDLHHLIADDFTFYSLPNGKEVGIEDLRKKMHGKERRLLVCYNEKQQEWNASNLVVKINKRLQSVQDFFDEKINTHKWRSKEAVIEKIEKLLGKKYFDYFDYKVTGSYAKLKYTISIKSDFVDDDLETLGKSYLMTNDFTSPAEEIVWKFRQQYTVERAFDYLKGPEQIRVRPMYHHIDSSIRGHILTCVFALLLLKLLEKEVRVKFPNLALPTIIELLKEMKLVQISFGGQEASTNKIANMSKEAKDLYKHLKLDELLEKYSGEKK